MKKLIVFFVIFNSFFGQAQNEKFKSGNYTAIGSQKGIHLKLNEDNSYEFIFSNGNFEIKNDTIYFHNRFADNDVFQIEPIYEKNDDSKLIFLFNYESLSYDYDNIYLGLRNTNSGAIEYTSFYKLLIENNIHDFYEKDDFTEIRIDKTDKIYLLAHSKSAQVYEFEIDKNISKLQISYNPNNFNNLKLKGYYSKDDQFFISDGKNPVIFNLVNEENIKPSSVLSHTNTFEEKEFIKKNNNDLASYPYEDYVDEKPEFQFKYKLENSLQESLKILSKTPKKFLAVIYDPKNKDIKTHFENFIEYQEELVSRNMYNKYDENSDYYNFYLASEKDKKALGIKTDEAQIVFLNSDNQVLYHTNSTIQNADNDLFGYYSEINSDLKKVNTYAKIDKVVANKKATSNEIHEAFQLTLNLPSYYNNENTVVADSTDVFEVPLENDFSKDIDFKKAAIEVVATEMVQAIDSTENFDYYSGIKDNENLYQLKSTKESVQAKWKQFFNAKKADKNIDLDFIKITTEELQKEGFTNKLFNDVNSKLDVFDFEMLDYLINNQVEVDSLKVTQTVQEEQEYYGYEDNYKLGYQLDNFFRIHLNSYNGGSSKEVILKLLPYFKKYIANQNNSYNSTVQYLNALDQNFEALQDASELYVAFENFFNSIIQNNSSIIESLNEYFEKLELDSYDNYRGYSSDDWRSFKNQFSSLTNSVAWNVVEKTNDVFLIKKAITWSEASLKVEKNNHYYLDTLAQLYYKSGQKQKGIETEEKAIKFAQENEDDYNIEEYKNVLEKMQNGTY